MDHAITRIATFTLVAFALAACGGAGSSPLAATAMQAPAAPSGDDAAPLNVSGQYAGTVKDNRYGKGRAKADLAQFKNAVGGTMTSIGSTLSNSGPVGLSLKGTALQGTSNLATSLGTCTFAEDATYDASAHTLSGSYMAVHGCMHESGTFKMRQKCTYKRARAQVDSGPKPC